MKSLYRANQQNNNLEDNLIPMINIIFLLLIFFMIAGQVSQLRNPESIQVPDSTSKKAITPQTIQITVTQDQQTFMDNQPIALSAIDQLLSNARDKKTVNLMVDADLNVGDIDNILQLLRQHNVQKVALFTQLPSVEATP